MNTSDINALIDPAPRSPWLRWSVILSAAGGLLAGGFLRFDATHPAMGRLAVLLVWALCAVGVWRFACLARPIIERQLAHPGGWEAVGARITRKKRAEWAVLAPRGAMGYVRQVSPSVAFGTWAALYSAAVLTPRALVSGARSPGRLPLFVQWALTLALPAIVAAIIIAQRWWYRAKRGWADETDAPAA